MKIIKLLLVAVITVCTLAAANAQLRLPPPPPHPPGPLHLRKPPVPVVRHSRVAIKHHYRHKAVRRPAHKY